MSPILLNAPMQILFAAILLMATTTSGAQESINWFVGFSNTKTTLITYSTHELTPAPLRGQPVGVPDGPSLSQWHVALEWFNPNNSSWESLLPIAGIVAPGRFVGGTRYHYSPPGLESFRVQAWSGSYATFYDALASNDLNHFAGLSDITGIP